MQRVKYQQHKLSERLACCSHGPSSRCVLQSQCASQAPTVRLLHDALRQDRRRVVRFELVEQNKIRTAEADIAPLGDLLNSLNEDLKVQ